MWSLSSLPNWLTVLSILFHFYKNTWHWTVEAELKTLNHTSEATRSWPKTDRGGVPLLLPYMPAGIMGMSECVYKTVTKLDYNWWDTMMSILFHKKGTQPWKTNLVIFPFNSSKYNDIIPTNQLVGAVWPMLIYMLWFHGPIFCLIWIARIRISLISKICCNRF